MDEVKMWNDSRTIFKNELSSGENILWSGKPKGGIQLRSSDIFMIPFSLLWGGFAIFWEYSVITHKAPFFFWLWGIPFVLVGLYIIFGRFIIDAKQRENTYYALTNERIIIVSGLLSRKSKSLNLRTLSEITLTQKNDGSGTITFGSVNPMSTWFGGGWWPTMYSTPCFEMIENAKKVYDKIREAQKGV
jgi:hypothetical protein